MRHDYTISGPVENVSYGQSTEWPCYIAMSNGDVNGERKYYFHAAKKLAMCQFAERSKNLKKEVTLYAIIDSGANVVDTIEFANTNSRWW